MRISRYRPALKRSVIALLLATTLLASGCSLASKSSVSGSGISLNQATIVADPKAHVGPSTARLQSAQISPVASNPSPQLPAVVRDAQGTSVSISDVSRILPLDLYGTTSRIVFDLGLGKNVVGRDVSSVFPEVAKLPLVTQNGHELNAEAILELAPSVIITDSSLGPWDVVLQMRDAGIPVFVVDSHRSIDSAQDMIRQVANALGVQEEGKKLAERTGQEIDAMKASIAAIAPQGTDRLRIIFLYARGQSGVYNLFGEGSGADSLITGLGGIDVATEMGWKGMRPMTDEALVKAQPDLVIMMSGGLESTGGIKGITKSIPALAFTPAGEKQRIVDMDDSEVLSFGPNSAAILEALAVAVYAPADPAGATS